MYLNNKMKKFNFYSTLIKIVKIYFYDSLLLSRLSVNHPLPIKD